MVNFRFHLVSLTAVFLALAAGITIGAGVVDRATVDQIERQLQEVADRREATNAENDRLRADLARWNEFGAQLGGRAIDATLAGTAVFVVATSGIDAGLVGNLRSSLAAAGATDDGMVTFTGKWNLDREEAANELAAILDAPPSTRPADLRTAALAAIGTAWATGDSGPVVAALVDGGFLELEAPPGSTDPPGVLPRAASLFLVASGDDAEVPPAELAVQLVARLAGSDLRVLAVQPVRPEVAQPVEGEEIAPEFVFALRANDAVATRISTVDNADDFRGMTAVVYALRELQAGTNGHYGFGPEARLLPEALPQP